MTKIEKLEKQIAELQEELEREKVKNELLFIPKGIEQCWVFDKEGNIYAHIYAGGYIDTGISKTTQVYRTREQAEKALAKQQATIRVKKRIAELNDGWKPDWEDEDQCKYELYWDFAARKAAISCVSTAKMIDNTLYLKSIGLAEQLINEMRDDLKLMLEAVK